MAGLHKILLAEDNVELREIYALFLQQHGYEVTTATDGEETLEMAKKLRPDLIFLDIMMPKLDGFEILRTLRHDPKYGCTKTKIVLFTNLGDATKLSPEISRDMDGYVIKAEIDLSDLLEIITSLQD